CAACWLRPSRLILLKRTVSNDAVFRADLCAASASLPHPLFRRVRAVQLQRCGFLCRDPNARVVGARVIRRRAGHPLRVDARQEHAAGRDQDPLPARCRHDASALVKTMACYYIDPDWQRLRPYPRIRILGPGPDDVSHDFLMNIRSANAIATRLNLE